MYYKTEYISPLGLIIIVSDGEFITGLFFEKQKYFDKRIDNIQLSINSIPLFLKVQSLLDQYFAGQIPDFSEIPLETSGSLFRQTVWQILKRIPYGETTTYGEIALKVTDKKHARAVAGAIAHNPISILIPCHRVLGKNHKLTGYAGGLDRKKSLLKLEKIDISSYT